MNDIDEQFIFVADENLKQVKIRMDELEVSLNRLIAVVDRLMNLIAENNKCTRSRHSLSVPPSS
jgi:hypothetical protein